MVSQCCPPVKLHVVVLRFLDAIAKWEKNGN